MVIDDNSIVLSIQYFSVIGQTWSLLAWYLPKLAYLNKLILILELASTAGVAGQRKNEYRVRSFRCTLRVDNT